MRKTRLAIAGALAGAVMYVPLFAPVIVHAVDGGAGSQEQQAEAAKKAEERQKQAAEKQAAAEKKMQEARQKACENRRESFKKRMEGVAERSQKRLEIFDKITELFNPKQVVTNRREIFETYKNQLWQRVDHVVSALSGTGVRLTPLDTEELIELLYNAYNPSLFTNTVLKNIDQTEVTQL